MRDPTSVPVLSAPALPLKVFFFRADGGLGEHLEEAFAQAAAEQRLAHTAQFRLLDEKLFEDPSLVREVMQEIIDGSYDIIIVDAPSSFIRPRNFLQPPR